MNITSRTHSREVAARAIRAGRLTPKPCEHAGCQMKAHAHHDDYAKPLEVRWFCPQHHRSLHIDLRARGISISPSLKQFSSGRNVTTTISLEQDLHRAIQRAASGLGQSVSQWIVDAANRKIKSQRRARE